MSKVQTIKVYGRLETNNGKYWLIHPRPIDNFDSWLKDGDVVFYVVPFTTNLVRNQKEDFDGVQYKTDEKGIIYPYPRHLVLSGDYWYAIEYLNDVKITVKGEKRTQSDIIKINVPQEDLDWLQGTNPETRIYIGE